MVENNKRIAEIDSQLRQAEVNLKYQELQAPVSERSLICKPTRQALSRIPVNRFSKLFPMTP